MCFNRMVLINSSLILHIDNMVVLHLVAVPNLVFALRIFALQIAPFRFCVAAEAHSASFVFLQVTLSFFLRAEIWIEVFIQLD